MALISALSTSRPPSRSSMRSDQPRSAGGHVSLKYFLPNITSPSVRSPNGPQPATRQAVATMSPGSTKLIHGYMVCGLGRLPEDWTMSTQVSSSKAYRTHGSIGPCMQPTILGSIPPQDKDAATAQMFSSALKATFPNDAEVCASARAPVSTCHGFVLQMHSTQTLYGVALKLWVKSDVERTGKILEVLAPQDSTRNAETTTLWMPYCLAYISHYPLFDLMSDYLRCTWMLFGKDPDKFNSNGVLRVTRLPSPQPDQVLRIELDKYTFSYHMPAHPKDFQNFALWPFFTCLTPAQIIAILEAALSSKGRIVFTSQYLSMMTIAAETVRYYVKSWAGLYIPIVNGSHAQELLNEDGPYILGLSKQSRATSSPPRDALVVDLDQHRIYTSRPPGSLSPRQRKKYAELLYKSIFQAEVNGPPQHLRTAYEQNSRFSAAGSMMSSDHAPRIVGEPAWWEPGRVLATIQHISRRVRQNYKLLSALDTVRRQTVKVDVQDLNQMIHDRNHFARNNVDAWDTYIKLKRRTDVKVGDLLKRETSLKSAVAEGKKEFAELSECTEQLIEDTRQLQKVVNQQKRDNTRLDGELQDKTTHAMQLSNHVSELENELSDANHTLAVQQELIEEIERSRDTAKTFETRFEAVSQERDEAHRAVIHLTSLISGQIAYIERVLASLIAPSRPASRTESRSSRRRSFQNMGSGSPIPVGLQRTHSRSNTMDFSVAANTPIGSILASQISPVRSSSPLSQVEAVDDEPSLREKVGAVAATVRKINQQCLAAIQDLAERRNELDAPVRNSTTPENGNEGARDSPDGSERTDTPHKMPVAEKATEEDEEPPHRECELASVTGSEASKATGGSNCSRTLTSATPDLDSSASTVRSESATSSSRDEFSTPPPAAAAMEPRIQSILEVDENENENVDEADESEDHVVFLDAKSMKSPYVGVQEVEQEHIQTTAVAA